MSAILNAFKQKLSSAVDAGTLSPRTRDEYVAIGAKLLNHDITTDSIPSKSRWLQVSAVLRKLRIFKLIAAGEAFGLNVEELQDKFKKSATDNHKLAHLSQKYLTRAQFDMFLDAIPDTAAGEQLRRAASLSYGCGSRMEETLSLRREDFEILTDVIVVTIRNGKGGKPRRTYMSKDYAPVVEKFVPFSATRKSVNVGSVRAFKKAGLHTSFHALRHSFATDAARNGVPVLELAAMLGHSDPKTTMMYYHVDAQASQAVLSFLQKR